MALFDLSVAQRTLAKFFELFLENSLNLRATFKAHATWLLHLSSLALLTATSTRKYVTCQPLAQVAAVIEIFEQESVLLLELFTVTDFSRLRLTFHDYLEVHDLAGLCFLHLHSPSVSGYLFIELSRLSTHLEFERFLDKVKEARAHSGTLLRFLILTSLCSFLNRVHVFSRSHFNEL